MTFYIRRFILMQFSERFNEDILSFHSRAKTDRFKLSNVIWLLQDWHNNKIICKIKC